MPQFSADRMLSESQARMIKNRVLPHGCFDARIVFDGSTYTVKCSQTDLDCRALALLIRQGFPIDGFIKMCKVGIGRATFESIVLSESFNE